MNNMNNMNNMNKWEMPQWMLPYTSVIVTGQDRKYIESMINDNTPVQINTPRALIAVDLRGRVEIITTLYHKGLLNGYDPERVC